MALLEYFLAGLCILFLVKILSPRRVLPPGPKGLPLLGNVLGMPTTRQWLTYDHWAKKYGSDIVHTHVLGQSIVVLNSFQAVDDLLEKRSAIYSDRPNTPMMQEIMAIGTWALPFMPYGSAWRTQRKLFHTAFHANIVSTFSSIELDSTRQLLLALLETPQKFRAHINAHTGRIILKSVYGYDAEPEDDPIVELVEENFRWLNGKYFNHLWIVDVFPILKYLPKWAPFQRLGTSYRAFAQGLVDRPFNLVKASLRQGQAGDCIVTQELENIANLSSPAKLQREIEVKHMAATAYPAGQDTTASALATFVLAMTLYPEQQRRAQKELDAVTGGVRLPTLEDAYSIPFIRCILLETLRWGPALPGGVPHRAVTDDVYKGYYIPEGSLVFENIWGLFHDESAFPDSCVFNADRFSRNNSDMESPLEKLVLAGFGAGRRVCPGRHLAYNTLWLSIAQMLAILDIRKDVDEAGSEIVPEIKYTEGLTSHPEPYRCLIVPRSSSAIDLVTE